METIKSLKREIRNTGFAATGRVEPSEFLTALVKEKFNPEVGVDKLSAREELLIEAIGEVLDAMDNQRYGYCCDSREPGIKVTVYDDGRINAED